MNKETIYSENFKRWFGDWENDPQNASKVVDNDGKPLPVEHGTTLKGKDGKPFKVFNNSMDKGCTGNCIMFTDSHNVSSFFSGGGYARFGNFAEKFEKWHNKDTMDGLVAFLNDVMDIDSELYHNKGVWDGKPYELYGIEHDVTSSPLGKSKEEAYKNLYKLVQREIERVDTDTEYGKMGGIYKVFLNIRNPYIFDAKGNNFYTLYTEFNKEPINANTLAQYVKNTGQYDGVIIRNVKETTYNMKPSTDYIVFNPNQIKHALDNNGDFNSDSDDITESKSAKKVIVISESQKEFITKKLNGTDTY